MPLYLWNGKLLLQDGSLAASEDCCCSSSSSSSSSSEGSFSASGGPFSPWDPGPFAVNNFDEIYAEHTRKLKQ